MTRPLRFLLLLLLALAVGCAPLRRGSSRGGSGSDDDDSAADDDDAVDDDDDSTPFDDDDVADDDDSVGEELTDPDALEGDTFDLDLAGATWVEPPGVGALLASALGGALAFSVLPSSNLGSGDIELRIGFVNSEGDQDPCYQTSDVDGDWSNPGFDIGPEALPIGQFLLDPADLQVTFGSETSIIDGSISGTADMRDQDLELFLKTNDPDELCALFSGFGIVCSPCSSDGQEYCVDFNVQDLTGARVATSVLSVRTANDVANDPNCF